MIIIILIGIVSISEANLLINPSLEQTDVYGQMKGWTSEWNNNIFGTSDNPRSGDYAARNYWDGGMYQDVDIFGGELYKLTGWVYIPKGEGESPWGSFIGLQWFDDGGSLLGEWSENDFAIMERDQYNMGGSNWLVAPGNATTARVRFGTWSAYPFNPVHPTDFDDFNLSTIPEPGTILLFLSGLLLCAFSRRSR